MTTADLIWLNGEFVAWEDAKVHVLTHAHALRHRRLRGHPRLRDRARHRRSSATTTTSTRLEHSAKLYYMDLPFSREAAARGHARADRRATASRAATSARSSTAGYGPMGLNPLDNPVEAMIAVWEWGAYLGEEGKQNGVRARVSSYRRISPDSPDPALEGVRAVPELGAGEDRGARSPATTRRSCSTTRATSARAPARTCS